MEESLGSPRQSKELQERLGSPGGSASGAKAGGKKGGWFSWGGSKSPAPAQVGIQSVLIYFYVLFFYFLQEGFVTAVVHSSTRA